MAIDQVHDLQQVYRKLLHTMSRPGTISCIQEVTGYADYQLPCYDATIVSALTLLDAEVTFHILSESHPYLIEKISEYTLARFAPINEADYIIVLQEDTEASIVRAMKQCKNGNLVDPQASATWIIESSRLADNGELMLTGAGIKHTSQLQVGLTPLVWQTRNERIKEYPLGIDLIFTDERSQIVCVPRTTSVELTGVN